MRAVLVLTTVIVTLAAVLGFHWITYPGAKGRVVCALPKEHLSFDETVVTADSQLAFAFQHPIFTAQITAGKGFCINR